MRSSTMLKSAVRGFSCLAVLCLSAACVNQIGDEDVAESNIPISFSAKVSKASTVTRVGNSGFEAGDRIGLFATMGGASIDGYRYIDNLRLEHNGTSTLIPEREVFYPEGDGSLDFLAYYPYSQAGVETGSTVIPVSVLADQSIAENRSASDFLVATKTGVKSSSAAVSLTFKHRMSKLNIELIPGEGANLDEIYQDNPKVIVTGFYTKAHYDLKSGEVSSPEGKSDIVVSGKWKKDSDRLTGKDVIVIPQEADPESQSVVIEWKGILYTCPISAVTLEGNTQRAIQIKMAEVENRTLAGIVGEVEEWGETTKQEETEGSLQTGEVHIAALSFGTSSVYRLYNNGRTVAEICKEYLVSEADEIASQAIVAYPVKNEVTDLTLGIVLQLIGQTGEVHGGKVNWDAERNTFAYTAGTSAPVETLYLDEKQSIVVDVKPETCMKVNVVGYRLRDMRAGKLDTYSVVKIGTQYWMRQDLCAVSYKDGTPIERQTNLEDKVTGYFQPDDKDGIRFYNGEALLANDITPDGWRIPSTEDWTKLKKYLNGKAGLLKAASSKWEPLDLGETTASHSGLTGFNAYPVGTWIKSSHQSAYKMVGYWTMEADGTLPEQTVFLTGSDEGFVMSSTLSTRGDYYKALSIRCVKE